MENIFISHIHEEALLAKALKEELEGTTVGHWQVFVSSDSANITLGDQWFSKIDAALGGHRLLLVLCSLASMQRLWIGYEVGYAAAKGVPVIPICHSGLNVDALPSFLSRYQGVSIDAPGFVTQLFEAIQKHIPLPRPPRFSEQEIAKVIQEALGNPLPKYMTQMITQMLSDDSEIEGEDCQAVFKALLNPQERPHTAEDIAEVLNMSQAKVEHYVYLLLNEDLIFIQISSPHGDYYGWTKKGKSYAFKKGYVQ